MTKCCMSGKTVRCPLCNSTQISLFYKTDCTYIYCQNNKNCESSGKVYFKTYHYSHKDYPNIIEQKKWDLSKNEK